MVMVMVIGVAMAINTTLLVSVASSMSASSSARWAQHRDGHHHWRWCPVKLLSTGWRDASPPVTSGRQAASPAWATTSGSNRPT
jgi:hypothetical protein